MVFLDRFETVRSGLQKPAQTETVPGFFGESHSHIPWGP